MVGIKWNGHMAGADRGQQDIEEEQQDSGKAGYPTGVETWECLITMKAKILWLLEGILEKL